MIPLRDENPSRTIPVVTLSLVALNVAGFLYELWLGPEFPRLIAQHSFIPLRLASNLSLDTVGPPLLTLISSMFLHGGWAHLLGNMWYLWIFGDNVEDRLGHITFAVFYLASGVAAALIHFATHQESSIPTVGASGAIAGVLGGYFVTFPRARVMTLVPLIIFFQVIALPAVLVLGLWFVFQFVLGTLALGASGGGVAWWAHIGGFAFGAIVMRLITGLRRERPPVQNWE